ncbi:TetR family transcriptional regulator [Mycobacterium antarcticum]|uniref:TetR/AcrR family transcriptional regulator n=1 Tax=unclassified Mycolicibacterium TaxID=2636767 RepID=UPI002387365B|nr:MULTISPECIES: TetR/AcrR family transcriptional regulator [unclassified Mycolicibacterium]BDX32621.1 TetR family transcriptional regulator [Mycolicibacterium sp. TUM20985]GLP83828.1 TetR family transcriptional regulator [Mycolicibacterium sp. TUM20984]
MTEDASRSSRRLDPDPRVRKAIIAAAATVVREEGVRGVSVAQVLTGAGIGTRAFYRHFDSKDQLVSAVFLDMARAETRRLRERMATSSDPIDAVVAWIDGRLDLAFDERIESDLRQMSLEAQSQMFAAPEVVGAAYAEIMAPLIDELARGLLLGSFTDVEPAAHALSIHGALWSSVEKQWASGDQDRREVRRTVLTFCLRGLGVAPESIADVLDESTTHLAATRPHG